MCADPVAKTPIGVSGFFCFFVIIIFIFLPMLPSNCLLYSFNPISRDIFLYGFKPSPEFCRLQNSRQMKLRRSKIFKDKSQSTFSAGNQNLTKVPRTL